MRTDIPEGMEKVWREGDFTGAKRAMARVTVQHPMMRLNTYSMRSTFRRVDPVPSGVGAFVPYPSGIDPTKGDPVTNTYADYLFNSPKPPKELPNVKSVSWTRSTDLDAAEATLEFWNTAPLPLGEAPLNGDLDQPGFYTAGRGTASFSSRWKHEPNEWVNMLMPDNLLRTYEGYGFDPELPPERDPHLVLTGVWSIDSVRLSAQGTLIVKCRDLCKLLLDHQSFLPVVPDDFYPVSFKDWSDKVTIQKQRDILVDATKLARVPVKHLGSGNDLWPESAYVGAKVHGHSSRDAFDGKKSTYWLSVGNSNPANRRSIEYVDMSVKKATVSEVRFHTKRSGYTAYVSLKVNGEWKKGRTMPYRREGIGRYEEGVPYVASKAGLKGEGEHVVKFDETKNVTMIRLWLGNLQNFGLPGASKHRAALREVQAWGPVPTKVKKTITEASQVNLKPGPAGSNPGRVQDFTDIVKIFCAWAGLFWPTNGYEYHSDGAKRTIKPKSSDTKVLGSPVKGRVWGDFAATGTAPPNEITAAAFDKKSLMDGVAVVRDMLGFMFYVDETGAAQWRLPNVWTLGNWVGGMSATPGRTNRVLTIDERQVLLGLDAEIQSRNVREGIFVANPVGHNAAFVGGYNPNPTGMRRVGGWTDGQFESLEEARVMADLVAVRQLFLYRQDQIRIPAYPAIQIDDQVRVFERVTSEGFVHYVKGISSSNDITSGQWTYDLQTHWLGDDPNGKWVFNKSTLHSNTQAYVDAQVKGAEYVRHLGR